MERKKDKVICAMSGGVDSSVAAALLKKQGHDVVGIFMKFWREPGKGRKNRCCSMEAEMDARRVANKLKIPFYSINVAKEFKHRVVDYFIKEYKKGNTPNPCVECNRWIKFRFLLDRALALKADFVATGHYAKVKKIQIPNYKLLTAKDKQKDQSYFLWALNQEQLSKIIFPIGDYTKEQVRGLAKKWGLPVFEKKDSQEICFVNDLKVFLKKYLPSEALAKEGDIITTESKKVGEHKGLVFYTIGQRKGIEIGGIGPASPSQGGPFYVVKKDFKNNALIVSKSEKDLLSKEMTVKNINWISGKAYAGKCKVKIRSTAPMVWAIVKKNKVVFDKPQRAITSGQSAVFYKQNRALGGGIIC